MNEDKPTSSVFLMTDQQKVQSFIEEYKLLRDKYGFDFAPGIQLIKINVDNNLNTDNSQSSPDPVADKAPSEKPDSGDKK